VSLHRELARVAPLITRDATAEIGYPTRVVSSGRSLAEQRKLYAAYKRGTGGRAAPPGESAHNYGLAVDVVIYKPGVDPWEWATTFWGRRAYRKLHAIAERYGLESIVSSAPDDPFHLQAPNWRSLIRRQPARAAPRRR